MGLLIKTAPDEDCWIEWVNACDAPGYVYTDRSEVVELLTRGANVAEKYARMNAEDVMANLDEHGASAAPWPEYMGERYAGRREFDWATTQIFVRRAGDEVPCLLARTDLRTYAETHDASLLTVIPDDEKS